MTLITYRWRHCWVTIGMLRDANDEWVGRMNSVKQLYDLQEIDLKISERETSLAEVRARLADDSALTGAREQVGRLNAHVEELNVKRRGVDRTIAELQEKLNRVETRLYGGAVTGQRELSAAEEERNFILSQNSEEEDVLLELMVGAEDTESAQREAQQSLERIEISRPTEMEELVEAEGRLAAELARLGEDREKIATLLSPDIESLYDSLRKTRGGHAVAKVVRGMCQGCRLTLSTMERQRARSSQSVVRCSSCQRILYVI